MAWLAVCVLLTPGLCTLAQEPASTPPSPPQTTPPVKLDELPPQVRLGLRAHLHRVSFKVASGLVVVRDPRSYLDAIAAWTPTLRFPVLIDDGTRSSREGIARFARAFRPDSVVEWRSPAAGEVPGWKGGWSEGDPEAMLRSLRSALGAADDAGLRASFAGGPSPGVVVTRAKDAAWTAALALSAGRNQLLVFVNAPGDLSGVMAPADADALCAQIERACEESGLSWRAVGDSLDAVTLCLNTPVKLRVDDKNVAALSDRVGRLGTTLAPGERWAWAGQVIGDAPRAAYAAMCSLFLTPKSAWLFDGYEDKDPWRAYDASGAAATLRQRGFAVELDDSPKNGVREWRLRAARALDAGLVLVNTKGNADFFELTPGLGRPEDVPIFQGPALVHMVHSWSAQWPARRDLLSGRFLERGAYGYTGSVEEPFLSAFVATPAVALRLCGGAPWGVATRTDSGKLWKIAVLGDPLALVIPTPPPERIPTPLEGAKDLGEMATAALRAREYARAARHLSMLGRDEQLSTLASAMLQEKRAELSSELAAELVLPSFRAGNARDVASLFEKLDDHARADPELLDALWLSALSRLDAAPDDALLALLYANLRPDSLERDAVAVGRAASRKLGVARAIASLDAIKTERKTDAEREAISRAIAALRTR